MYGWQIISANFLTKNIFRKKCIFTVKLILMKSRLYAAAHSLFPYSQNERATVPQKYVSVGQWPKE